MNDGRVDPGLSSIFIPSCVVDEVLKTEKLTLDYALYLSLLVLWVKYGGRQCSPIFSSIFIPSRVG